MPPHIPKASRTCSNPHRKAPSSWGGRATLLAFALILTAGLAGAEASSPPPLWAYFKNPVLSQARISPSGNHIAAVLSKQGMEMILVWNVQTNEKTPILKFPGANYQIKWLEWANDERIVFSMQFRESIGGAGFLATHLYGVDRDGERLRQLSEKWDHAGRTPFHDRIASFFEDDPKRILVHWHGRILSVDVDSGLESTYQPRTQDLNGWLLDPQERVRGGWRGRRGTANASFYARTSDSGPFEKVEKTIWLGGPHFKPIAFDPETPNILYALSDHEMATMALYRYDIEKKTFVEKLFGHPRYDVKDVLMSPDDRVVGAYYIADGPKRHYFDDEWRRIQAAIDRALPGADNRISDWSRDEQKLLIVSSSPTRVPTTYLFVRDSKQMIELFRSHADLPDSALGPVKRITVEARDGLKLRAFVTLPPGVEPKTLPLVTIVHGGPASRDVMRFDPWAQFLASRGFAVLQVNYRGSTGYGGAFIGLGFGEWGLAMQDDVTDAVQLLIDKGVADPDRVAIFGASYGGYAAYMGLIKEPELFRCGASYGGVSDLHLLLDDDGWFSDGEVYQFAAIGDEVKDREKLDRTSPVNLARRIDRPVLVAHSRDDQRVDVEHSKRMLAALKKAKAPHEELLLRYGMHSLNVERERIRFFKKLERFLEECTAPTTESS